MNGKRTSVTVDSSNTAAQDQGVGVAVRLIVSVAGAMTLYDNYANSGRNLLLTTTFPIGSYQLELPYSRGLCLVTDATAKATLVFDKGDF